MAESIAESTLQPESSALADRAIRDDDAMRVRRVMVVAMAFGTASIGVQTLLPLFAVESLGFTEAQFARLISVRYVGVMLIVAFLGTLSDRLGPRELALRALAIFAVVIVALSMTADWSFMVLLPILGAVISSIMVGLNHLVQLVRPTLQARANTLFRTAIISSQIIGPIAATTIAGWVGDHGYRVVILLAAAGPIAGVVLLRRMAPTHSKGVATSKSNFAQDGAAADVAADAREARLDSTQRLAGRSGRGGRWQAYRRLLSKPSYVVMHLLLMASGAPLVVGLVYGALRLTQELHVSTAAYGWLTSSAAVTSLAMLWLGDRWLGKLAPHRAVAVYQAIALVAAVMVGLDAPLPVVAVGFVLLVATGQPVMAAASLTLARWTPARDLNTAISLFTLLAGGFLAMVSLVLGWLQPIYGMRLCFLFGAAMTMPAIIALAVMRQRLNPVDDHDDLDRRDDLSRDVAPMAAPIAVPTAARPDADELSMR